MKNHNKQFFTQEEIKTILEPYFHGVIGLWGAYGSGKSLFSILSPFKPIAVLDNHGSNEQYEKDFNFTTYKVNINEVDGNNSDALMRQIATLKHLHDNNNLRYGTIIVESTELFTTPLYAYGSKFFSPAQVERASGLVWGKAKETLLKAILILKEICDLVIVTAHDRNEFVAGTPTGEKEAKFLEPVWELSHLVLYLNNNNNMGLIPSAITIPPKGKSRHTTIKNGVPSPKLPPCIPEFTWQSLANYFKNPVDYNNLLPEETTKESYVLINQIKNIVSKISNQ